MGALLYHGALCYVPCCCVQAELYDEGLYTYAASMAGQLDDRFGLPHKRMMSQVRAGAHQQQPLATE